MQRLFPNLEGLYQSAVNSYEAAKADSRLQKSAALDMRNFIEKFQGELFEMARERANENMTWETMAKRLAKRLRRENADALANEESTKSRLHSLLSAIQKGWPTSQSLADIWPQFLDHTSAVSGYLLARRAMVGQVELEVPDPPPPSSVSDSS